MADIDVVPKRRTNTWAWILLALVLLAVLILLAVMTRADALTTSRQLDRTLMPSWNAAASTWRPA